MLGKMPTLPLSSPSNHCPTRRRSATTSPLHTESSSGSRASKSQRTRQQGWSAAKITLLVPPFAPRGCDGGLAALALALARRAAWGDGCGVGWVESGRVDGWVVMVTRGGVVCGEGREDAEGWREGPAGRAEAEAEEQLCRPL